ncbi:putative efflux system component YknX [Caloramator mitchellensis]|uniref:Putative efflux system component YknX n=1 Tax=Caloramator mitchellensis TaxID=908809 RepID=A0A0R3JQV7_CALMK|nr:efflux RND transporter periplasmic adaptor subunit [Caloramator mitchellensis]KRQ85825.1 putative efflux system component YknX [Caloramator mitchellensis]
MKKAVKVISIILVVLSLFMLVIMSFNRKIKKGTEVTTDTVKRGEIVSLFSTSGVVESKDKKDYFGVGSKVVKIYVSEGERVKKGQKLLEFEVQDLTNQLKIAENQLEIAKIQLENLKEQTSSKSIDNQIKIQEKQVEIARLNVLSIKDNISKQQRYITADFDGIVTALNAKEGSPSQGIILTLEDTRNLKVSINVNQYDVVNLKVGQKAKVKFYDREYEGVIDYISPVASKVQSAQGIDTMIKTSIKILKLDETIKSGFDVDVDIILGKKENALKIPAEAVITDKYGNEFVFLFNEGMANKKKIKTGFTSDVDVEVLEGLKEGDKVILNPPSTLTDGAKVSEKEVKE